MKKAIPTLLLLDDEPVVTGSIPSDLHTRSSIFESLRTGTDKEWTLVKEGVKRRSSDIVDSKHNGLCKNVTNFNVHKYSLVTHLPSNTCTYMHYNRYVDTYVRTYICVNIIIYLCVYLQVMVNCQDGHHLTHSLLDLT